MFKFEAVRVFVWLHAAVVAGALPFAWGCGDATCPAGSESMDGECVPSPSCGEGLKRVGNTCMLASGVSDGDSGKSEDSSGRADDAGPSPTEQAPDSGETGETDDDDPEPPRDGGSPGREDSADGSIADAAPQGDAPDPCEGHACGDHGHCVVTEGQPICECDPGYAGDQCDGCDAGMGLAGDECVPACEADAAPDCGAHGACELQDDVTVCVCEHPAAGELCDACAEGFALQDDGSCQADCGDCGAHGYCDATLMIPACACFPGYVRSDTACEWSGDGTTGGVVNGGLDGPTGWALQNGTIANGAATFEPRGSGLNCGLGSLSQTLQMPTREQAEPLMLELETTTTCVDANPENCPPLLVEIGTSLTRLRIPGGPGGKTATHRICLGDAAYGGAVPLRVRPGVARITNATLVPGGGNPSWPAGFPCESMWPSINAVRITNVGAATCAQDGGVADGAIESPSSWRLTNGATISAGALTLPGGATGSTDFLLSQRNGPPSPAIHITLRSTGSPGRLEVKLDGLPIAALFASSTATTQYVCVPSWARGAAHQIDLTSITNSISVETIEVKNAVLCAGDFDSGFELPLGIGSWFIHPYSLANSVALETPGHGGAQSIRSSSSFIAATQLVPPSQNGAHASVSSAMQMKGPGMQGTVTFAGASPAPTAASTATSNTSWTIATHCLGQLWDGQPMYTVVSMTAVMNSGSTETPAIRVDDLGAVTDAACPATP